MRHTAPKLRGHGGISFSWHLRVLVISDIGPIIFRHHEPTNLKTTFAILGLIGFLASAIAHVVTFFGIDPSYYVPWIWVLHAGIFVALLPLARKTVQPNVQWPLPRWSKFLLGGLLVYALVSLVLFLRSTGTPDVWNGRYVLHSHGHLIRELSEREYHFERASMLRGFSGLWMMFYLFPTLDFWYSKK